MTMILKSSLVGRKFPYPQPKMRLPTPREHLKKLDGKCGKIADTSFSPDLFSPHYLPRDGRHRSRCVVQLTVCARQNGLSIGFDPMA